MKRFDYKNAMACLGSLLILTLGASGAQGGNAPAKTGQTIKFAPLASQTYGDASFTLGATDTSGLPVSYTSSNPSVATVSNSTVRIVGAGATVLTASQPGNNNYLAAASVSRTLAVAPKPLTVSAIPLYIIPSATIPFLSYAAPGLLPGDRLGGALATTATPKSAPGTYPITQGTLSGGADYRITFAGASLTVARPPKVAITSPVGNRAAQLAPHVGLAVQASVTADAPVDSVKFYQGGVMIGESHSAPYLIYWSGMPQGTYQFTARVTDTLGVTALSAPITISLSGQVQHGQVAMGEGHSLAILSDGTVDAWGWNTNGQVGVKNYYQAYNVIYNPAMVVGLSNVAEVAAGSRHSLALLSDGTVKAWGNNTYGQAQPTVAAQIRQQTTNNIPEPVAVNGLSNVTAIAAGSYHSLALLSGGNILAWGYNFSGQLGGGLFTNQYGQAYSTNYGLIPVKGITNAIAIAAGKQHSLALLADGTVMGWGMNGHGAATGRPNQFDNWGNYSLISPRPVLNVSNVVAIAAGDDYSIAALSDGTLVGWGYSSYAWTNNPVFPTPLPGLSNVVEVAAGSMEALALLSDGTAKQWGLPGAAIAVRSVLDGGMDGYVLGTAPGNPHLGVRDVMHEVNYAAYKSTNLVGLAQGSWSSIAIGADDSIWTWGNNFYGSLGNTNNYERTWQGYKKNPLLGTTDSARQIIANDKVMLAPAPELYNFNYHSQAGGISFTFNPKDPRYYYSVNDVVKQASMTRFDTNLTVSADFELASQPRYGTATKTKNGYGFTYSRTPGTNTDPDSFTIRGNFNGCLSTPSTVTVP